MDITDLKTPPHHIEAEKWVLSSILIDNDCMYVLDGLSIKSRDFYQKEHQLIYDAIISLWAWRKRVDLITLSNELGKAGFLEIVWWADYLADVAWFLLTASACGEYAQIVKEKAILRDILYTSHNIIWDVYKEEDTLSIIDRIEKRIFELTQFQWWDKLMHISQILDKRLQEYHDAIDNPDKPDDYKVFSWYPKLDEYTAWFKPWELIILAARPAMWKTAFALNLMLNAAIDNNKSVALFSLEMSSEQIIDRMISVVSNVGLSKITKNRLEEDDFSMLWQATSLLSWKHIYIDDHGLLTLPILKSKLRRLVIESWKLDMVVIDYLWLISSAGMKYAWNRVQEVSEMSRWLKELAKELKVPIVALSQLSRNVEQRPDKKPVLSDLRDSWSIEQDADMVIFLYRDEYYDPDTDRKWISDILLRKNRNGTVWEVELRFHGATTKFLNA
jgi:replicative DNA helicase